MPGKPTNKNAWRRQKAKEKAATKPAEPEVSSLVNTGSSEQRLMTPRPQQQIDAESLDDRHEAIGRLLAASMPTVVYRDRATQSCRRPSLLRASY